MALQVAKGVFAVTTTGGADIVISGLTDPKAIFMWSTRQTTDGQAVGGGFFLGWFTFDGAAVQQGYISGADNDGVGTSETGAGGNSTACLKGYPSASPASNPTIDFELRGVSMDATSITIDTFDAPSATVDVHYMAFGGSDLTRARAGMVAAITAGGPAQDVTVVASGGKPELVLMMSNTIAAQGDLHDHAEWSFGVGKDGAARNTDLRIADAAATMDVAQLQKANIHSDIVGGPVIDAEAQMAARTDWPTDGFRISWSNLPAAASSLYYLALYGTFQHTLGADTVPIAGITPVAQNIDAGFAPAGAILWGGTSTATTAIVAADQTADTDGLGGLFIGGTDGTNEGYAGLTENDAHTTSTARRQWSESKAYGIYTPANGANSTLRDEADGPFSGNNLALSWTTIQVAGPAREFNYLILGSASSLVTANAQHGYGTGQAEWIT